MSHTINDLGEDGLSVPERGDVDGAAAESSVGGGSVDGNTGNELVGSVGPAARALEVGRAEVRGVCVAKRGVRGSRTGETGRRRAHCKGRR